ncbi:hypothetical protein [Rheinheimera baltica]|uniref:hypothetical protein n=1 Tax=Rheinheimera baltica TaxID=67576 RepID=UPI0003FE050C|nr:hypothetical protein [Rheinheimera baltica]
MNDWSPEQQITTLKFGSYSALFASGMFASKLATNVLSELQWQWSNWISGLSLLFALCFLVTVVIWSKKGGNSGGWREILGIYSEEYAREINNKANSNGFLAMLLLLLPGYILGDSKLLSKFDAAVAEVITLNNYVLLMLVLTSLVWGLTVLFKLRDEGDS